MGLRAAIARPFNAIHGKYTTKVKLVNDYVERVQNSFKLPERFKGTIVERWADYWTAVCKDYTEAVVGIVTEARDKPLKGALYASAASAAYYCSRRNPDESDFRNTLLSYCNDFIFVGPDIRNPETAKHLRTLEKYYNEGIIKRQSFGIFSVMWVDNFRDDVGIYKATCQYMTPEIVSLYSRIVDVGFLNRWWILEKKMIDCDINPDEWGEAKE